MREITKQWMARSIKEKYSYNFSWMGLPVIQYPQDLIAMQEIIWKVKPDLIIETGVAHGGSLVFYASMLEMMGVSGTVVGVDVRLHTAHKEQILNHLMSKRVVLFEGSSISPSIVEGIRALAKQSTMVLVALDSHHTLDHVLKELELYSPLVTKGSYLVVFDTCIQDFPETWKEDRPWNGKNNPAIAVEKFLETNDRFVIDRGIPMKLDITVAETGYLRCLKHPNGNHFPDSK